MKARFVFTHKRGETAGEHWPGEPARAASLADQTLALDKVVSAVKLAA